MRIPEHGLDRETIFETLESFRAGDLDWKGGRTFAYYYDAGPEVDAVAKEAFTRFMSENAIDPTVYPSLLKMENDVVAMAAAHLGGDEHTVGSFTSGGTESILCAVKAARDHARKHKPEIERPHMVLPATGHPSFQKAAKYFGLDMTVVDVDAETYKADPQAIADAITESTILLVVSTPSYAHGVIDPVEAVSEIARERGLWLHVDACIGGFLLPYFRRLGADVPPFDLSVPGVSSISMDFHKYGYGPKGSSVVLYRDKELRSHQWFASAQWTGYTMFNSTIQSTRGGGPIAGTWAVLNFLGEDGYLDLARRVKDATTDLAAGIEAHPDLYLLAKPEMCLLAFRSDTVGIFHIIDEMRVRGWYVQPQLHFREYPANIHLSVHPGNVACVPGFLKDLSEAVEAARALPTGQLAGLKDEIEGLDIDALSTDEFSNLMAFAGATALGLPERLAGISELLDMVPGAVSERLIARFLNELYVPTRED